MTHGQPFARLLELDSGDEIIVETRDAVYTYVLDEPPRQLTVKDTDTWVIEPVPGRPERTAHAAVDHVDDLPGPVRFIQAFRRLRPPGSDRAEVGCWLWEGPLRQRSQQTKPS